MGPYAESHAMKLHRKHSLMVQQQELHRREVAHVVDLWFSIWVTDVSACPPDVCRHACRLLLLS